MNANNMNSISDIYNYAYTNKIPISVTLELNTTCNFRCKHCYIPKHIENGLEFEKIQMIFQELRNLGTLNITLTGGEVFLRDDILSIIEYARQLGFRIFILSNGSLVNEETAKKLSDLYISEFSTTIFSMNKNINDKITGKKGSLNKIMLGLKELKKNNVRVFVKCPITNINVDTYREVEKYAKDNQFRFMISPVIFSKIDGDSSNHALRIDAVNLQRIIEDYDRLNCKNLPKVIDDNVPCTAIHYSMFINSKGEVYPCNSLLSKIGTIFESTITEIWNNSTELRYLQSIKNNNLLECRKCTYKKYCERCPGLALLEDKNILGCSSIARKNAVARYESLRKRGAD
jgi:radical SAM protein with 4Fe4S-binding SPASM domain